MDNYIKDNDIADSELLLFKFNKIYTSFNTAEVGMILDISESIIEQLKKFFTYRVSIFRFSLSEYIVIPEKDYTPEYTISNLNNSSEINFTYKGVVLQHKCTKIPVDDLLLR